MMMMIFCSLLFSFVQDTEVWCYYLLPLEELTKKEKPSMQITFTSFHEMLI